jgi:Domain of unknown function (DUF4326)
VAAVSARVVNIRSLPPDPRDWPPDHVYIGRAVPSRGLRRSRWANSFRIDATMSRDEAVAAFEVWLRQRPRLLARLPELRGKTLVCWCWPERCHGHVLARLADES